MSFERDYKTYFPVAVTRIENNKNVTIPIEKLEVGNIILIRNQEIIPADSVITSGNASIDYSFVSGESLPIIKKSGDFVFAGGRQLGAAITVRVENKVEQSYLTRLWNQSKQKSICTGNLKNIINKVSQYFTIVILIMAP